jgi:hypothetical protein
MKSSFDHYPHARSFACLLLGEALLAIPWDQRIEMHGFYEVIGLRHIETHQQNELLKHDANEIAARLEKVLTPKALIQMLETAQKQLTSHNISHH